MQQQLVQSYLFSSGKRFYKIGIFVDFSVSKPSCVKGESYIFMTFERRKSLFSKKLLIYIDLCDSAGKSLSAKKKSYLKNIIRGHLCDIECFFSFFTAWLSVLYLMCATQSHWSCGIYWRLSSSKFILKDFNRLRSLTVLRSEKNRLRAW